VSSWIISEGDWIEFDGPEAKHFFFNAIHITCTDAQTRKQRIVSEEHQLSREVGQRTRSVGTHRVLDRAAARDIAERAIQTLGGEHAWLVTLAASHRLKQLDGSAREASEVADFDTVRLRTSPQNHDLVGQVLSRDHGAVQLVLRETEDAIRMELELANLERS
jgi:hypothetical protein